MTMADVVSECSIIRSRQDLGHPFGDWGPAECHSGLAQNAPEVSDVLMSPSDTRWTALTNLWNTYVTRYS